MENKKTIQLLSALIVMAFLAMPFTVFAQAGKANFAGTWAFNASKSEMGQPAGGGQGAPQGAPQGGQGRGGFGGGDFTAKQEANLLTVERTRTTQDGQTVTTSEKYTLDGKETVNANQRGGETKSTATWSADGKSLNVVTTRDFNGNIMKTTAVWTLTSANTLTVTTTMSTPNGDRTTKAVYDKK
jgi:hypothetical protein